jgi:hypothetical protein
VDDDGFRQLELAHALGGRAERPRAATSSAADCKLVREKSIFYLPFNANLS